MQVMRRATDGERTAHKGTSGNRMDVQNSDIVIVGGGAVGLAAGIALARQGWRVCLASRGGARRDGRTVALMDGSVRFLEEIGAWDAISPHASPLCSLSIIDDTGGLFRAPPVTFHSGEIGLDAFGYNIENATLVEALLRTAEATTGLTLREALMTGLSVGGNQAVVTLDTGESIAADLVAGADGRSSPVREAAGIASRPWDYDQAAVTAILAHDRPHNDTSTEFHTRNGPFTLVPLEGRRSSLVWLTRPDHARKLSAMEPDAFALAVERQAQSMLGRMRLDGPRGLVPMSGLSVDRFTAPRIALLGEAAHVFPPIGAQGLNLGLRDAAALAKCLGAPGGDAGGPAGLAAYEASRGPDVRTRTTAVDALNRSLLAGLMPVDALRGAGLMALASIGPLRRFVMRQGLGARA